jgi:S1-C subfamily serine protease
MNNNFLYSAIFAIFGAAVIAGTAAYTLPDVPPRVLQASLFSGSQTEKEEFKLTQEQLVDLVKPSVVRVVQSTKVKAEVPAFAIDFGNGTVKFGDDPVKYPPYPVDFEAPILGSGFIINPDGYILTNAHVVSDETMKRYVLAEVISKVATAEYYYMSQEQLEKISEDTEALAALGEKVYKEVSAKINWDIDRKITVINPTSKDETMENMIANGFPAEAIKVNDNYNDDERDVAIIKIEEGKLPAVKLASALEYNVGAKIFVFGFPSTAEFSKKSFIEPTFTQGVISAVKESEKNDFKTVQFDAKVSEGSSGSPMIDDTGAAIGIVTYQTGGELKGGDNFAFAIPIEIGKNYLSDVSVENVLGNYAGHLKAGLVLAQNKRCKKAIEEFNLAKDINSNFNIASYVDPYIENCNAMIEKGESVDSKWAEIKEWTRGVGYLGWAIIGAGALVFVILIIFITFLAKKMKGKEKEINQLEDLMLEEAAKENVQRDELEKMLKNGGKADSQVLTAAIGGVEKAKDPGVVPAEREDAATVGPTVIAAQKSAPDLGQPQQLQQSPSVNSPAQTPTVRIPAVVDSGLAAYVKQARGSGFSDEIIAEELKKSGWSDSDIKNVLTAH